MQVSNVVDRCFELVRREWRAAVVIGVLMVGFFLVGVAFFVVIFMTAGGMETLLDNTFESQLVASGALIASIVTWVAVALVASVAIYIANGVATRSAMHGPTEGSGWSELGSHVRPSAWASLRLLGWSLLLTLAVGTTFALLGFGVAALGSLGDSVAVAVVPVILMTVAALVGAVGLMPYAFVTVALVYGDELAVLSALGEARHLMRGRYWPALGASLILYLFSFIPVLGGLAVSLLQPFYMAGLLQELRATR